MSEHWRPAALAEAARLPEADFVSWVDLWATPRLAVECDQAVEELASSLPQTLAMVDASAVEAAAFARGLVEGQRLAGDGIQAERAELAKLAEALEALRPEPSAALAGLLAETVDRLVRQIVGEVAIDETRLLARAREIAQLVTDATRPARLRLAPADRERLADADLPVELVADPALGPGSLVLETEDGWIEDGPAVALDGLRAALERMGVPR